MLNHFSRVQLCGPMNCSLPDSSVHGILQARILEWVAISLPRGSSQPRDQTPVSVSCIGGWVLYHQRHLGSPASGEQHFTMMQTHRIACLMGSLLYSRFLFMGDCTFAEMLSSQQELARFLLNSLDTIYGEGNGTPLQYSCLGNPMDGGAWWAAVHGVATSWARLSDFTFTFHFPALEKEMATHSSVLAWRIPGTGETDGLLSMGWHRVRHN